MIRKWTIGQRIAAGYCALLLLAAGVALFAADRFQRIQETTRWLSQELAPDLQRAGALRDGLEEHYRTLLEMLSGSAAGTFSDKAGEEHEGASAQLARTLDDYEAGLSSDSGSRQVRFLKEALEEYLRGAQEVRTLVKSGQREEVQERLAAQVASSFQLLTREISGVVADQRAAGLKAAAKVQEEVAAAGEALVWGVAAAAMAALVLAFLLNWFTSFSMRGVVGILTEGSQHITSAGLHLATASQTLAQGASKQAASLEETTSSLGEMSSMTKKNADNAQSAKDLANQARTAAETGAADMLRMSAAMDAMKASSDNIAKIIKTIDEIAFQTNLLALNAAVEAARAGDAGSGFAVVAEEVRNLAQRSAQAARETAEKIEDSIRKSESGVDISQKIGQSFKEIVRKARQVDELIAEIALATKEQTLGIDHIRSAVGEMDQVTQLNASSAEQTASASEELHDQAQTLREAVKHLSVLVGGRRGEKGSGPVERKRDGVERNGCAARSEVEPCPAERHWEESEVTEMMDGPAGNGNGHSERASGHER